MSNAASIHYLQDSSNTLELIYCRSSAITYPLHNHISVFTIGLVLDGVLTLTTDRAAHRYHPSQTFILPPYVPHSIASDDTYSLLSLCIHKDLPFNSRGKRT